MHICYPYVPTFFGAAGEDTSSHILYAVCLAAALSPHSLYFCWGCGTTYSLLIVGAPLPAHADVRKLLPSWGPFLHVTLSLARAACASLQHHHPTLPLDLFELYTPLNYDTVSLARNNHSAEDVNTLYKAHYNTKGGSLHYLYAPHPHKTWRGVDQWCHESQSE